MATPAPPSEQPAVLSVREVAHLLNCGPKAARSLVKQLGFRAGKHKLVVLRIELLDYIAKGGGR